MDYDFVEIGTCYFDTLIEGCDVEAVGISIEPIYGYLAVLPNKPKVSKVNAALVSPVDMPENKTVDLYFVHPEIMAKYGLGGWLSGCNTIGKPHDFHVTYYPEPAVWHDTVDKKSLKTRNLLEEGLVSVMKVPCITFAELVQNFNISKIKYLKIDTEGYDCILLNSVLDFCQDKTELLPDKIRFESNAHTPKDQVIQITERLKTLGYAVTPSESGHDTVAVKNI